MSLESIPNIPPQDLQIAVNNIRPNQLDSFWEQNLQFIGAKQRALLYTLVAGGLLIGMLAAIPEVEAQSCTVTGADVIIRGGTSTGAAMVGSFPPEGQTRAADGIVTAPDGRRWVQITEGQYAAVSVTTTEGCTDIGSSASVTPEDTYIGGSAQTMEIDAACVVTPQGASANIRSEATTSSSVVGTIESQTVGEGITSGVGGDWVKLGEGRYVAAWVVDLLSECTRMAVEQNPNIPALDLTGAIYRTMPYNLDNTYEVYHGPDMVFDVLANGYFFTGTYFDGRPSFGAFLRRELILGREVDLPDRQDCTVVTSWQYYSAEIGSDALRLETYRGLEVGGDTRLFTSADANAFPDNAKYGISLDCYR